MTGYKIPDRAKRSNGVLKYQRHLYATCPPYKERKGAFTLTELLVAMSIIGIVAVLTVPFITGNTFGQSYRAKAESVRELILASANSVFMRERVDSLEDSSLYLNKADYFNNYIKTSRTCGTTAGECFAASYKTTSGNKTIGQFFNADSRYYVTLQNGASVAALTGSGIPSNQAYFIVDANGKHGPNTLGVDMYVFNVHSDGTAGVFGSDEAVIAYNDNVEPDPTEQTAPTTPTDPTDPTGSTEPTEPTAPTSPTSPSGDCPQGLYCHASWQCDGNTFLTAVSKNPVTGIDGCYNGDWNQNIAEFVAFYNFSSSPTVAFDKCSKPINNITCNNLSVVCGAPDLPQPTGSTTPTEPTDPTEPTEPEEPGYYPLSCLYLHNHPEDPDSNYCTASSDGTYRSKDYWAGAKKKCAESGMSLPSIGILRGLFLANPGLTGGSYAFSSTVKSGDYIWVASGYNGENGATVDAAVYAVCVGGGGVSVYKPLSH